QDVEGRAVLCHAEHDLGRLPRGGLLDLLDRERELRACGIDRRRQVLGRDALEPAGRRVAHAAFGIVSLRAAGVERHPRGRGIVERDEIVARAARGARWHRLPVVTLFASVTPVATLDLLRVADRRVVVYGLHVADELVGLAQGDARQGLATMDLV